MGRDVRRATMWFDIADAHAGVEEKSLLGADDQIGNDLFGLDVARKLAKVAWRDL